MTASMQNHDTGKERVTCCNCCEYITRCCSLCRRICCCQRLLCVMRVPRPCRSLLRITPLLLPTLLRLALLQALPLLVLPNLCHERASLGPERLVPSVVRVEMDA